MIEPSSSNLRDTVPVMKDYPDQGDVARAVSAGPGAGEQLIDLGLGKMFDRAAVGIDDAGAIDTLYISSVGPGSGHLSILDVWSLLGADTLVFMRLLSRVRSRRTSPGQ